jgi:2-keto-4-pentenoate hydratase/2-oxohepta-3-ene-1,7-dioic acid hydratase in catechol pathway
MRLVTYAHPDGARPAALVAAPDGDRLLDLTPALCAGATTVVEIVADPVALSAARDAVESANGATASLPSLADVVLLPPVRPGKILCLGYNYRGHVAAGEDPAAHDPEYPDVFVKTPNVLAAPGDPVALPAASSNVDYEGEIALVIGRRAHDVPLDTAMDHVAGYTIFNDVSDRDWQDRSSQWELGKCFDGFGPLGPALVTADEVADPHDLLVEVVRDGEVTVSQNTSTMVFSMPYIVHYLSQVMTLEPGDIISTGTPQKLPQALADHRPLAHGDSVTVRVGGLGELTTTFTDPTEDNHDS